MEFSVAGIVRKFTVLFLRWDWHPACGFPHDRLEANPTFG